MPVQAGPGPAELYASGMPEQHSRPVQVLAEYDQWLAHTEDFVSQVIGLYREVKSGGTDDIDAIAVLSTQVFAAFYPEAAAQPAGSAPEPEGWRLSTVMALVITMLARERAGRGLPA